MKADSSSICPCLNVNARVPHREERLEFVEVLTELCDNDGEQLVYNNRIRYDEVSSIYFVEN